jgi:hypothetical protein
MENRSRKIASATVPKPADHVRMADAIECDGFVLKILDERTFKIGIKVILQKDVQRLYDDLAVRGLRRRKGVTRDEDLGVTPAPEKFDYVVTFVDPAIA